MSIDNILKTFKKEQDSADVNICDGLTEEECVEADAAFDLLATLIYYDCDVDIDFVIENLIAIFKGEKEYFDVDCGDTKIRVRRINKKVEVITIGTSGEDRPGGV